MGTGLSLTFGLYLVCLVGIGVYFFFRSETRRLSGYILGGRSVGTLYLWPATFPILVWPLTGAAFLGACCATAPSSPVPTDHS